MKVHDCKCSSPEFCPDENQWEPSHQCEECHNLEQMEWNGLVSRYYNPLLKQHIIEDDLPF